MGVGIGDVKLAGVVGALLGWVSWWAGLFTPMLTVMLSGTVILDLELGLLVFRRIFKTTSIVLIAPALIVAGYGLGLQACSGESRSIRNSDT